MKPRPPEIGRLGGNPTQDERFALAALEGVARRSTWEIAKAAGMTELKAERALRKQMMRGNVYIVFQEPEAFRPGFGTFGRIHWGHVPPQQFVEQLIERWQRLGAEDNKVPGLLEMVRCYVEKGIDVNDRIAIIFRLAAATSTDRRHVSNVLDPEPEPEPEPKPEDSSPSEAHD